MKELSKYVTRIFLVGVMLPAVVAWACLPAQAGTVGVKLSDLLETGDEIVSGDKKFDEFTYSWTGEMPPPNMVNVVPITDEMGNFGLRFQGAFMDLFSSQGGSDALITYRVMVLDPGRKIVDAHLAGNPELLGDTGSISVTESFTFDTTGDNFMSIFSDEGAGDVAIDWTEFSPRTVLNVRKDIVAFATETGSVTMSYVDQTFSQIPEASTGAMMLVGTGCLAFWQRQRRRRRRHR